MEFDTVVKKRKSVRNFAKKKVNWRRVLDAIETANQGPFSDNINNLHFLIIEDPGKIKDIAKHCDQPWIGQAGIVVVVCSDDTHVEEMHGERGRIYSRQQSGAAIMSFLLKITDMGLASCWIGSYTDEMIKSLLYIPQHIQIEGILPIGYEKKELGKKAKPEKKELYSSLFWESWEGWRRPPFFQESKNDNYVSGFEKDD